MNNRTLIAILAVGAIAVAGAFAYTRVLNSSKSPASTAQEDFKNSSKESISSLLMGGKTAKCDLVYKQMESYGTVYTADKKFRGDFKVRTEGAEPTVSHIVSDGVTAYVWTDGQAEGFKMNAADAIKAADYSMPGGQELDSKVDMKCASWVVDNSKFVNPRDVKFTDMSSMMQGTPGATGSAKPGQEICDKITDSANKAACLEAIER